MSGFIFTAMNHYQTVRLNPTIIGLVLIGITLSSAAGIRLVEAGRTTSKPTVERYRIDPGKSTFMVRAFAGGLLWFKGKDHFIAVRDFSGEATLTEGTIVPATLQITIKSDSLVETRDIFTEQEKQIINKELREIVLQPEKYPEITFKSTNITGKLNSTGQFETRIDGDLTLHGVTRRITIPANVTVSGSDLRARGDFTVERSDFNVKATSAVHGMVRVRDKLKFTFDIVAHRT